MKTVTAIDPGSTESAIIRWNDEQGLVYSGQLSNDTALSVLRDSDPSIDAFCAIEMIACYGMAVGAETFETCVWIGRFIQACPIRVTRVFRKDIKIHLCGSLRAKDANIRQALIDKHGAPGTKKAPGKTYGISGHLWAALAVADYALSLEYARREERG